MTDQQLVTSNEEKIQKELAEGFFEQGRERFEHYDYGRAVFHYTQAIYIQPQNADYFLERGNAHRMQGNLDEALEDYDSALHFDPGLAEAYFQRGTARRDLFDLTGAVEDFEQYLEACAEPCAEKRAQVIQTITDLKQQLGN